MKIKDRLRPQRTLTEDGFEVWELFVVVGIMAMMLLFASLISSQIRDTSETNDEQQQIENPNQQQIEDPEFPRYPQPWSPNG